MKLRTRIALIASVAVAVGVLELAEKDDQKIDRAPDPEAAEREQLDHRRGNLPGVEAVRAEPTEEESQQESSEAAS